MTSDFNNIADDFFVNLNLQTNLPLPSGRETILHFCEAVQKQFPDMAGFYRRETGEYVLEGEHDSSCYKWLELHENRLAAGFFNPPSVGEALAMHSWLLDRSFYFLGVSNLDVECLDVVYGFNLNFCGNRDEIAAKALLGGSPLGALLNESGAKCIEFEPSTVLALDQQCYLQARLSLETRCNSYQVRTGTYEEEPITVSFTVRQYPTPGEMLKLNDSFKRQARTCDEMVRRLIIPHIVEPIAAAIISSE